MTIERAIESATMVGFVGGYVLGIVSGGVFLRFWWLERGRR